MRALDRARLLLGALALSFTLAACENLENLFSTKKPLPGERKPVFEGGVPGVPQGVPPELVRGYKPPPEEAASVAAQQPEKVEKPKPKPKPRATAAAPGRPAAQDAVAIPPPATSITVTRPSPAGWPAAPPPQITPPAQWPTVPVPTESSGEGSQASESGAQPAATPWPNAPPPGTFSR